MYRFSVLHQMGKCSKFHPIVRFWNNFTRTFPKPWKLLFYQFPITWMIHAFSHKFPAFCVNPAKWSYIYIFFFIWVFFHEHSRIARLWGKGEGISLTPNYHFHPLYRHLNIASSWTGTGNLWKSLFCLISSLCYTMKQFPILPQDMPSSLI